VFSVCSGNLTQHVVVVEILGEEIRLNLHFELDFHLFVQDSADTIVVFRGQGYLRRNRSGILGALPAASDKNRASITASWFQHRGYAFAYQEAVNLPCELAAHRAIRAPRAAALLAGSAWVGHPRERQQLFIVIAAAFGREVGGQVSGRIAENKQSFQ